MMFKGLKVYLLHLTPAGVFEYNSTKMIYTYIHKILKLVIINVTTNNLNTNINTKIHSMLFFLVQEYITLSISEMDKVKYFCT